LVKSASAAWRAVLFLRAHGDELGAAGDEVVRPAGGHWAAGDFGLDKGGEVGDDPGVQGVGLARMPLALAKSGLTGIGHHSG